MEQHPSQCRGAGRRRGLTEPMKVGGNYMTNTALTVLGSALGLRELFD